ncbi:hypothetical protein NU219Hw_g9054t1 [Hortaea werneckii]
MDNTITPARRPASPDAGTSERKRKRKVLSCYDCRRRKLQCDRQMPACGRCSKAGNAANCLYIDDPAEASRPDGDGKGPFDAHISRPIQQPPAPLGDALSRLEYQERRIKQLEAALAQNGHTQSLDPMQRWRNSKLPLTPESVTGVVAEQQISGSNSVTDRETMMLRGKSFKTQFNGTTHRGSLIAHIPDLNVFTKETFERFPALARIRQDMHGLEDRTESASSRPHPYSDDELKALVPSKTEVDPLLQLYFANYGSIYHIIHLPSFWQEYTDFWADVKEARAHFAALLLLMIAAAQCLTSGQPWLYAAGSSMAREKAVTYIQAVDEWLRMQSQKRVTATDFQIRFLLLLARQASARKYKRTWTDAGNLLRFCMCAGLHRNPDLIRKPTSALDKELRRRIWQAVVELELQAAFDRGMVSAPWTLQADCPPPINMHDRDVDQDSEQLPTSVPAEEFTNSSYLSKASESTLLRHGLNTTLNNIRQTLSFNDVKRFSEEIETHLQAIPDWQSEGSEAPRALLVLNLRQYLLVLHDRQIRQAESSTERSFSRMMLIDNATRIIDTHRKLINKGCYALELTCNDQLRAALSICHVATTVDIRADSAIGQIVEHHANRVMEEAIQMLTDKVIRFGREQRQLWIALAAHGFWKSRKDPANRTEFMQEAVEKITRPYYKIMACQQEESSVLNPSSTRVPDQPSSAQPPVGAAMENGALDYLPPAPPAMMTHDPDLSEQPLLDLDEIEAWTFENWAFDPAELQQAFAQNYPSVG